MAEEKKKMGRPRIEIDKRQFEQLCGIQATEEEIYGWFKCSSETIRRWCRREYGEPFCEVYKKFSSSGKISLRRNLFHQAEKSVPAAIFLAKQHLGMRDNPEEVKAPAEPIRIVIEKPDGGNA